MGPVAARGHRPSLAPLYATTLLANVLLLPLSHPWDGQTWHNVFMQLAAPGNVLESIGRPYATLREMSLLAQSAGRHSEFYEYWAYPPFMLYVHWPIAQLYRLLGGVEVPSFPVPPTFTVFPMSLPITALVRLPVVLAQLMVLSLLQRLGVARRDLWWYTLNPLVLLTNAWTFDTVNVLAVLAALWLARGRRWFLCGAAVAGGAAVKFFPLLLVPALCLAIVRLPSPDGARLRSLALLLLGASLTLAVLVAPVQDGVVQAISFHASRFGGGLSVEQVWRSWAALQPAVDWQPPWQLYATSLLGNLVLPAALLAASATIGLRPMSLTAASLLMVLAFLFGSKLVNEPYALLPVALATVLLAAQPSPTLRRWRLLLWLVPFCYAVLNTPPWAFLLSAWLALQPGAGQSIQTAAMAYRAFLSQPLAQLPYITLGLVFAAVLAVLVGLVIRSSHAFHPADALA